MRDVKLAILDTPSGAKWVWTFDAPSTFCPGRWTAWVYDGQQYGLRCDLPHGLRVRG